MNGPASPWSGLAISELGAVDLVAVRVGSTDRDAHGSWRVIGRRASRALVRLVHADLDRAHGRGNPPAVDLDALIRLAENLAEPRPGTGAIEETPKTSCDPGGHPDE